MNEEQRKALEQQKQQCPFCKIVAGEIPSKKVYEDDRVLGILDIAPAAKGHVLLLPKEHYPIMAMVPEEDTQALAVAAQKVSHGVKQATLCHHTTLYVASGGAAGQQAPHFMMHVIPREENDGLFALPGAELADADVQKRDQIKQTVQAMMQKHFGGAVQSFSKQDVLQIIEQNPQIKELMLQDPEEFKQLIPQNPQLKQVFANVNVDEIIADLSGEPQEPQSTQQHKEQTKTASQDQADLDKISKLFQ